MDQGMNRKDDGTGRKDAERVTGKMARLGDRLHIAGDGVNEYSFIHLPSSSTCWVRVRVLDAEDVGMRQTLTSWSSQSRGENQCQAAPSRCAQCSEMSEDASQVTGGGQRAGRPRLEVEKAHWDERS